MTCPDDLEDHPDDPDSVRKIWLKTRMKVVAAELRGGWTVRRTARMIWSQARMIRMNAWKIWLHPPNFCDARGDIIRTIRDKVWMIRAQLG